MSIVYENFVKRWQNQLKFTAVDDLLSALLEERHAEFGALLSELIRNLVSCYDTAKYPEAAYHCFVLGLLANLRTAFDIQSNPESGYGRADILMRPLTDACRLAFVIEFKVIGEGEDADKTASRALKQIKEKAYATRFTSQGVPKRDIREIAIVIQGKSVTIRP